MKGIFITGTDTGVGKTYVAAGLIEAIKNKGFTVCPVKPVETGCRTSGGILIPSDTVRLLKAAGVNESPDSVNPYRFSKPLAPAVAAELEGRMIKRKKILCACKKIINTYDVAVIEGAGGIMVPLYKKYLILDLIKDIGLPLVIVSRPGLGTINHTLLTVEVAKNIGLDVSGVIINHAVKMKNGLAERTNPGVIEDLAGVPVLGHVPHTVRSSEERTKKVFHNIADKLLNQ